MGTKKLTYFLTVLFAAFVFVHAAVAQEFTVSGSVTEAGTSEPLPGISIVIKGTTTGTTTNFDGLYNLRVNNGQTLVFSYIGYKTQEFVVTGNQTLNVQMEVETESLDEVIVVGYGSVRKRDVTGSVASVKPEDFNTGVTTSPSDLIQGKVSGLMITNSSGDPGANSTIRIRGNSSVRSGNDPLIVVDGVPLAGGSIGSGVSLPGLGNSDARNPLNFINPNDIASIDVLKDASATAIYGSRGANGVIIITTKKGSKGKTHVDYNSSFSTGTIARRIPLFSTEEFAAKTTADNKLGADVNGFDTILRTSFSQSHNVAMRGGSDDLVYRLSLSSQDQQGIIKDSGLQKYTANLTATHEFLNDRLIVDANIIIASITDNHVPISNDIGFEGNLMSAALNWNPTRALYKPDGSINQFSLSDPNPLALLAYVDDNSKTQRILNNFAITLKLTNQLNYKMNIGIDQTSSSRETELSNELWRQNVLGLGYAVVSDLNTSSQLYEHTLNYNNTFSQNFRFEGLLGYSYQVFERWGKGISGRGFTYNDVSYINQLQAISQETRNVYSWADPSNELQSFFGRVNFSLYDKVLVTATMRADGSSKFGVNNKYGFFPSMAMAYRLSDESFVPEIFDDLKVRVGWGMTGNQEFPAGASQEQYSITRDGLTRSQFDNPDLRWETSTTYNAGIDFSLLESRLSGSVEYFNKTTVDLLFNADAALPGPSGTRRWQNLDASVINKGLELSLNATLVNGRDFSWDLGGNVSFIENLLDNFSGIVETGGLHGQGMTGTTVQRFANGYPLNVFYTLDFKGLDANGIGIYSDQKEYLGDPNPKTILGLNTRLTYKQLDLSANLNGAFGHYIYNNTFTSVLVASNPSKGRNSSPLSTLPNESDDNAIKASSRYLEKGDFLRLNNMTLGYNVKSAPLFFSSLRFSVTGQNLFVLTSFNGFDPEVNVNKAVAGVPSYGIEYIPYPTARVFTFGLNASF